MMWESRDNKVSRGHMSNACMRRRVFVVTECVVRLSGAEVFSASDRQFVFCLTQGINSCAAAKDNIDDCQRLRIIL